MLIIVQRVCLRGEYVVAKMGSMEENFHGGRFSWETIFHNNFILDPTTIRKLLMFLSLLRIINRIP